MKRLIFAGMIFLGVLFWMPYTPIEAAPEGYPWYNSELDARNTFVESESQVFAFFTARLIEMKDHATPAVGNVADAIIQQFLEDFAIIEPGADPAVEPVFAEERQEVKRILFEVSPPAEGGNADTVWEAIKATLIVIPPPEPDPDP